jgi:signal transduction histidine kinase
MGDEKRLKILMLEDNQDDVLLIEHVLRKNKLPFVHTSVDTRDEFREAIRQFQPDVILSDHGLPGFNSREALKICLAERPSAPFILVTGTVTDEYAISCLNNGADDYILKSNLSRLPTAIRSAVRKRKLERMKREARHALRKQNEELMKVNKELDNFVYSVSHNLRGPLASMIGLLRLAKEGDREGKLAGVHNMMGRSMYKLDETLKEILDYSRNARGELQFTPINWENLIQQTLSKLEYLDSTNCIEKSIRLLTDDTFVSDEGRVAVILNNLLNNAMLFHAKNRKPKIDVDIETTPANVVILIRDNGIGIREDAQPRIFEMFYRGTEESQGAGLGLYIVKETVARLNGSIELSSVHGQGTTVTVVLPNHAQS